MGKNLLRILFLFLLLTGVFQRGVEGVDWKYCASSDKEHWFYDKDSIIQTSGNIMEMWCTKIPNTGNLDKDVSQILLRDKEISLGFFRIDCSKKQLQLLRTLDFSPGKPLEISNFENIYPDSALWGGIITDSVLDDIYGNICEP